MTSRRVLTDIAWARITLLLLQNGHRDGQWRDHCPVINGIWWKLCNQYAKDRHIDNRKPSLQHLQEALQRLAGSR